MADTGPRGPQGPAGTSIDLPVAIANGGTGATTRAGAANALQVESIGLRTGIPSNADLNDYTTVGSYCCTTAETAASLGNCPTTAAFTMTVGLAIGAEGRLYQKIEQFNNGKTWRRQYVASSNTWYEWLVVSDYTWEERIAALEAAVAAL